MELKLDEETKKTTEATPQTIKQMGGLDGEIRIYIEDYVYTYLYQYGRSKGGAEKLAALVGRYMEVDGELICMINGAIQGKGTVQQGGIEAFGEETWPNMEAEKELYFPETTVLGWVHIQNGFGDYLMTQDERFHMEQFQEKWQVFFVLDVLDHFDTFYVRNDKENALRQVKGYFVYYDKNEEMREYMLNHPITKPKVEMESYAADEFTDATFVPRGQDANVVERMDAAKKIRDVLKRRENTVKKEKRGRYATVATLSCFLSIVSLGLGLSLVSYMDRLQSLEGEISMVQSAYTSLETYVANTLPKVETQTVFSAETSSLQDTNEEEMIQVEKEAVGVWHMISVGDSLTQLSQTYYGNDQWVDSIMVANGLENPDVIFAGQEIWIP